MQSCPKVMKLIDLRKLPEKFEGNGFYVEFTSERRAIVIIFKRCSAFNMTFLYKIVHVLLYLTARLNECYMNGICASAQMTRLKVKHIPMSQAYSYDLL